MFIVTNDKTNLFEKKIKALAKLEQILHKPVDIVIHKNYARAIEQEIMKKALKYNTVTLVLRSNSKLYF